MNQAKTDAVPAVTLDLGPPVRWLHRWHLSRPTAYCGLPRPEGYPESSGRPCPDCERIAMEMFGGGR